MKISSEKCEILHRRNATGEVTVMGYRSVPYRPLYYSCCKLWPTNDSAAWCEKELDSSVMLKIAPRHHTGVKIDFPARLLALPNLPPISCRNCDKKFLELWGAWFFLILHVHSSNHGINLPFHRTDFWKVWKYNAPEAESTKRKAFSFLLPPLSNGMVL